MFSMKKVLSNIFFFWPVPEAKTEIELFAEEAGVPPLQTPEREVEKPPLTEEKRGEIVSQGEVVHIFPGRQRGGEPRKSDRYDFLERKLVVYEERVYMLVYETRAYTTSEKVGTELTGYGFNPEPVDIIHFRFSGYGERKPVLVQVIALVPETRGT